METYRYFDELIRECKSLPLSKGDHASLHMGLSYFKNMALADRDRHPPSHEMLESWDVLESRLKALGFGSKIKGDAKFWEPIYKFVGKRATQFTEKLEHPFTEARKFADWDAKDFFCDCLHRLKRTQFKSEQEELLVFFGLKYLHAEANRGRANRDTKSVKTVWTKIHPYLERYDLLQHLRNYPILKSKIKFFVNNHF